MTAVEISQTALKYEVSSLRQDTLVIKSLMAEIYQAFKGQPFLAPSGSVTSIICLTHIPTNVKGKNTTNTATKEPTSHTEMETKDTTMEIPISSIHPTKVRSTHDQPITLIISHPKSSQATPRIDKGIGTKSEEDPSKKLVPVSTIIRPDPNEPVRVEFMINRKIVYFTEQKIQEYWDKEEKIKKYVEDTKILAMSRPEVIKVIHEEAKKLRIDPKKAISTKASETFKKARDAEHESLNKSHLKPQEERGSIWNWNMKSRCLGWNVIGASLKVFLLSIIWLSKNLNMGFSSQMYLVIKHSKDGTISIKLE
uniref:Uncharacterized protein n=1 Tax=Tanacetum cinerariifolium TaxID=118510 RepID=A0A6L2LWE0_TANCI|nr:hypothetical protein [Tanacetum cinerariifolium]